MKLGLCLAGGGIKGAAHIGVLKAFEEDNIIIDYIAGTSSGSLVAVLYAVGYKPKEIYELFKKYSKDIGYIDNKNILKLIFGLIFKRKIIINGLNSGNKIEKIINEACERKGVNNIKQIKMPIIIPSVDLNNGMLYVFTSKKHRYTYSDEIEYNYDINIGKAVRASCCYPGVFSPCIYKNKELIDGGIRENVPWKELKCIGADKVISSVFEKELNVKKDRNIIEVIISSIDILSHELSNYELIGADYLLEIKTKAISLLDFKKIDCLYELGYKTAKEKMHKLKEFINE